MDGAATEALQKEPAGTALLQQRAIPLDGSAARNGGPRSTGSRAPNQAEDTIAGQHLAESMAVRPRVLRPEVVAFQRLESRDGVVLDVDWPNGCFRARLVDPRATAPDQEVDIELEQVSPSDLGLVERGALFFWAIGYVTRQRGRRTLVLALDFRRLPRPRRDVEERAKSAAEKYVEAMGWT